jgi:predicted enzyme related to lactoylglutathione lyase
LGEYYPFLDTGAATPVTESPPVRTERLASAAERGQDRVIERNIGGCMTDDTVRGRFVWHDLLTPNSEGAHEFYGKAVGWQTQAWEQDGSYLMFAGPSGPIGGTVETRATAPQWLPYISTADVDATVEAATRLGAQVQTPATALPNGGRFAALIDPQGAPFGIHASTAEPAPETSPQPGEFSWHELSTSVAPSIAFGFYAALFDWDEISQHDMGPMGPYLIFGRNGKQLGGMFDKGSTGKPGSAYWLGYVSVTDLDATVAQAKAARGSLLHGPMDVPGGDRIAQLMDPHGAFFALHMAATATKAPAQPAAKPPKAAKPAAPKQAAPKPAAPKPAAPKPAAKKPPAKKAPARRSAPKKRPVKKAAAKKKPAKKTPRKTVKKTKPKPKTKVKAKRKTKTKAKARKGRR